METRKLQSNILKKHLLNFWETNQNPTIYISGIPGTGKTYTIKSILTQLNLPHLYINCAYKPKTSSLKFPSLPCKDKKGLINHLPFCNKKHILIIDEIDLLLTRKQQLLYTLSELPYLYSNVLLIIISNQSDLPERSFNSKICSRIGNIRINFPPYTANQLIKIFDLKNNISAQLVCKRIGAINGDIRRVSSILRDSMDINDIDTLYNNRLKDMYTPLYIKTIKHLPNYSKIILNLLNNELNDKLSIFNLLIITLKKENIELIGFEEYNKQIKILNDLGLIKGKDKLTLNLLKEEIIS